MSDEVAHSTLGPSAAHRWRPCPGSVAAEAGLPDEVGFEAAEGTVFHEYAADCLQFGFEPEDFTAGHKQTVDGHEVEYDTDMQYYMANGLAWARERMGLDDAVIKIEKRVSIAPWCGPGQFGTSDLAIMSRQELLIIVFDWKYGKGVPVSPVKNDQAYLYTLGVWNEWGQHIFKHVDPAKIRVIIHIEQPRTAAGGGTWETNMAEVLAEGELIREDAAKTHNPHAPRVPGLKQCQFCKAKKRADICPERQAWKLDMIGQKFEDIDEAMGTGEAPTLPPLRSMEIGHRAYIAMHAGQIKKWLEECRELVIHDLRSGRDVPIVKLVPGKAGRRVYQEDTLELAKQEFIDLVGEEKALETTLVSPPTGEKLIGKKRWKEVMGKYCRQSPGKPILVPISDPRDPIPDLASKFEDIDEDEDE